MPADTAGVCSESRSAMPLNLSNRDQTSGHNDPQTVKVFGRTSAQQLAPGRGLWVSTEGFMEGILVGTAQ